METFGGIFVIILVSSDLLSAHGVSGLGIKNGTFQMLQKHPQLKKCVERVLKENGYVGCRVSELTGQCQGLPHSWGLNPTIEQGYAYAKNLIVENSFQLPPLKASKRFPHWKIPVVLNTGARIDISMSIPNYFPTPEAGEIFILRLNNGSTANFRMRFLDASDKIEIDEYTFASDVITWLGSFITDRLPSPIRSKEKFKISLLVQENSLVIFVEDEEITTFKVSSHFRKMSDIIIYRAYEEYDPVFIHGVKFTGK